jgi:hypothetical protein
MYYMLNSHNHFAAVTRPEFGQSTAQQFLHSLGYATTAHPAQPHYGVPPGHSHYEEAPPPYSPPGVPPPAPHHGPRPPIASNHGAQLPLGQLQTNIYNDFMNNLGFDPQQHAPYRPAPLWRPGVSLGQLQTDIYNNFLHNLGFDPQQHAPYRPAHAGEMQTLSRPGVHMSLAELQTNIYGQFMQDLHSRTQALGLSHTPWYGSGGWMNSWHGSNSYASPQPWPHHS